MTLDDFFLNERNHGISSTNGEETDFENALAKIDAKIAKIAELEEKLRQLKGNKLCGMCGKNNDAEAEYCSACGNKL